MMTITRLEKTAFAAFSFACVVHLGLLSTSSRLESNKVYSDQTAPQELSDQGILLFANDARDMTHRTTWTDIAEEPVANTPNIHTPDIYSRATGLTRQQLQEFSFAKRMETYPRNGTGTIVNVAKDFDPGVFNSFCEGTDELLCVLPVFSAVDRFESRRNLRLSLGRLAKKRKCKLFFIVGATRSAKVRAKLQGEYTRERDILVAGWLDTYRDLNNKAYTMVDWISKHCTNVPFVVHLIDDSYINLSLFLQRLQALERTDDYYMLAPTATTKTVRAFLESGVTVQEYPNPMFPKYAYGWGYAFPNRVAERLLAHAFNATYCWIEDVWIGGHVRISAGVKLYPIPTAEWRVAFNPKKFNNMKRPKYSVLHGISSELLNRFYTQNI